MNAAGEVIDWQCGYNPPSSSVKKWLEKVLLGKGTYAELMSRFKKNPQDIEAATELGKKYDERGDDEKALEFYREALRAHASGADGFTLYELAKVSCSEYAEYSVAKFALFEQGQESPARMNEFIEKYPKSPLLYRAYLMLSGYFSGSGSKEDAEKFFEEYLSRFPDSPRPYWSFAERIIRDGGDAERGTELMEKAVELSQVQSASGNIGVYIPDFVELQAQKGDSGAAAELFDEDLLKLLGRVFSNESLSFANFWIDQNILKDKAEKYTELAASLGEGAYFLQRLADTYVRLDKMDKALSAYGPDLVVKNWDNAYNLSSYASFWAKKAVNLESALKAARRSVELGPSEYSYLCWSTLSDILQKMKNYTEALQAAEKALSLVPASYSSPYKAKVEQIKKLMKRD